ncbi:CTP-dependent riboflavin kinase [Candidatus Micrarchaeota archaeon]|nr:CTP-dependent riboflavin kinase [Candidatus Micrarchaeota archaeon]
MKNEKISLLLSIAKRGGMQNEIKASSVELASELQVSQQTLSRWLIELANLGLISKTNSKIRLTPSGISLLTDFRSQLEYVFSESKKRLRLLGRVVSGMHEGRFYLSIEGYKKQLKKALKYGVFPGTLNIRLENATSIDGKRKLMQLPGIEIAGFKKNGRQLGGAKLFTGTIRAKGKQSTIAAIIPYKSHYGSELLEVVSEHHLRKILNLKNNDSVEVILQV